MLGRNWSKKSFSPVRGYPGGRRDPTYLVLDKIGLKERGGRTWGGWLVENGKERAKKSRLKSNGGPWGPAKVFLTDFWEDAKEPGVPGKEPSPMRDGPDKHLYRGVPTERSGYVGRRPTHRRTGGREENTAPIKTPKFEGKRGGSLSTR